MTKTKNYRGLRLSLHIIIAILAGFLCLYHTTILYNLFFGASNEAVSTLLTLQALFRTCIIISSIFVIFGNRKALWGMWASISLLIASQYWSYFNNTDVFLESSRNAFSYLRGYIIPSVITLLRLFTKP